MHKNILIGLLALNSIFLAVILFNNDGASVYETINSILNDSSVGTNETGIDETSNNETPINETSIDGPYLFIDGDNLNASWLGEEGISQVSIPVKALFEEINSIKNGDHNNQPAVLTYQGDYKVAALSDLHGQYNLMMTLLRNNKIIDEQGNWNFNDGHFVITGDVFDRGDQVTEILWFLYKLEHQAAEAGGQLHLLLGNHEVMILNGDLRYLSPKYQSTAKRLQKSYPSLFSKTSILGNWLRKKPLLTKVNNMLFVHGGFHPNLVVENRTLTEINKVFKDNLVKSELANPRGDWADYLHTKNGPIWYRGYFQENGASIEQIYSLLEHFKVDHLVVGHTSQKKIETRYQGKVIAIDSSIKEGEYGEILFVDKNEKWRGTLSGERIKLDMTQENINSENN